MTMDILKMTVQSDREIHELRLTVQSMQAKIEALEAQLKQAETEREAMRRTYNKTVERLEREMARLKKAAQLPQD